MFFEKLRKRHIGLPLTLLILYIFTISSLVFEHYIEYNLSVLCWVQRSFMVSCLIFVTVAFFTRGKVYKTVMDSTCILFCLGAIVTFYHLLIQNRFLPEPDFCRCTIPINISATQMEEIIRKNQLFSCANAGPSFSGISFDMMLFVMFIFLFIYLTTCFRQSKGEITS